MRDLVCLELHKFEDGVGTMLGRCWCPGVQQEEGHHLLYIVTPSKSSTLYHAWLRQHGHWSFIASAKWKDGLLALSVCEISNVPDKNPKG